MTNYEELFLSSFQELRKNNSLSSILRKIEEKEKDILLPSSIFSRRMTVLGAVVKYLKDKKGEKLSRIANLLGRSYRTVWGAYSSNRGKKMALRKTKIYIPLSVLRKNRLSAMEAISKHLRERGMRYGQIARIIKRDERTVWTAHRRAEEKLNGR